MVASIRSFVVAALLLTSAAWAEPFAVGVGETKVVTLSQRIAEIDYPRDGRVEVMRMPKGHAVSVRGLQMGKTDLILRTRDGSEVALMVNVTAGGSRAFTIERRAGQITLTSPSVEVDQPVAEAAVSSPENDAPAVVPTAAPTATIETSDSDTLTAAR